MNTGKLKELGAAWKALDDTYDNAVSAFIDAEVAISSQQLAEMKKMQDELFDLEVELYKVLQEEA